MIEWIDKVQLIFSLDFFTISDQQEEVIVKMGSWRDGSWRWEVKWRRNPFVWETKLIQQLHQLLEGVQLQISGEDRQFWKQCPSGQFSTSSAYHFIQQLGGAGETRQLFEQIWKIKIPPKAKILMWRIFRDRMPTLDNLVKRNAIDRNCDQMCPLCLGHQESAQHLFISSNVIQDVWLECISWKSLSLAQPSSLEVHFR